MFQLKSKVGMCLSCVPIAVFKNLDFPIKFKSNLFSLYSEVRLFRRTKNKHCIVFIRHHWKLNVKKIAFGNKEHTTRKKMGVSVLLRLFINSNEVCNTAYAL